MEAILLLEDDEPLRMFELPAHGLEVGSRPGLDIVVHHPDVAERHWLICVREGEVVATDVSDDASRASITMRPGERLRLSPRHALERIPDAPTRQVAAAGRTEPIAVREPEHARLALWIGRGAEARKVPIGARPITLGTAKSCDVVLLDRSVSARHCRVEPGRDGPVVRDLDSRNGTYVDGVRSYVARVGPGTRLRVGRTELRVVARDEGGLRDDGLVATSPAMVQLLERAEAFARTPYPVLVRGESGAGKEGIARALHLHGPRREGPFVTVNAGGLAPSLIESELFGHEKGAFTGAMGQRRGVFEQAHGGTLFLDEIGELPPDMQARLLRVLETGEVRRVGGERSFEVDVRIVCATHRDLRVMVKEGAFRHDLFYRLGQLFLDVPPLRQRPEDVRALALHFLEQARREVGPRALSEAAISRLLAYDWPGNARELRSVIRNAAASSAGIVDARDVDAAIEAIAGPASGRAEEQASIADAIERYGSLSEAARVLRIPRSTLRDRMRAASGRKKKTG